MPHYIFLGDSEQLHQKLGKLVPGVLFEVPEDLSDEADAMVDAGVMQRGPDEAPATAPADEPEFLAEDDEEDTDASV